MRQDNRGVSLIEIIIAITLLVICAVPLFKSMILSSQMNTKSRQLLAATNTAEAVMENLKADGMEEFIQKNQGNTNIDTNPSSTPPLTRQAGLRISPTRSTRKSGSCWTTTASPSGGTTTTCTSTTPTASLPAC